ncbi:MAG: hypothetical protein AABW51_04770 [Nanoarchaeota archaeon]
MGLERGVDKFQSIIPIPKLVRSSKEYEDAVNEGALSREIMAYLSSLDLYNLMVEKLRVDEEGAKIEREGNSWPKPKYIGVLDALIIEKRRGSIFN